MIQNLQTILRTLYSGDAAHGLTRSFAFNSERIETL